MNFREYITEKWTYKKVKDAIEDVDGVKSVTFKKDRGFEYEVKIDNKNNAKKIQTDINAKINSVTNGINAKFEISGDVISIWN